VVVHEATHRAADFKQIIIADAIRGAFSKGAIPAALRQQDGASRFRAT
jgi:hypothetical protein